jgi:cysteine desulfurase/selenocysteine lyase
MSANHPLGIDLTQFPIRDQLIYANHAGTSPMPRCAADRMKQFADEVSTYASAIYSEWTRGIARTRESAARLLGAETTEIAFSTSTTAGLRIVAQGIAWKPGDIVIVEERTFPANWLAWVNIAQSRGARVVMWPERTDYAYELEDLERLLKASPVRMVAATSANFATGFRQDMEAVGRLCKQHGALLTCDAIQTLGVFPLDVRKCHIDFLSADSHKWLMGPEGSAVFFCAKDKLELLDTNAIGWLGRDKYWEYDRLDHPPDPTARRFEEGAPNVAGILAMGESLALLQQIGIDRIAAHNLTLAERVAAGLERIGWRVVSPRRRDRMSSIVASEKTGIDAQEVVNRLLREQKVFAAARRGFLRISPHFYQTVEDMDRLVEAVAKVT